MCSYYVVNIFTIICKYALIINDSPVFPSFIAADEIGTSNKCPKWRKQYNKDTADAKHELLKKCLQEPVFEAMDQNHPHTTYHPWFEEAVKKNEGEARSLSKFAQYQVLWGQ